MNAHTVSTKEAKVITNPETLKPEEVHLQTYNFSGQLPPPEYFERYAAVDPSTTKVILDLALRQQEVLAERDKSEIAICRDVLQADTRYSLRGQWFAFFTVLGFFILIGCAIFQDQQWVAGAALSFTALGYILQIFVNRPNRIDKRRNNHKEMTNFKP